MNVSKQRNTNLEILRIISMMLIIAHHLVGFGMGEFPFVGNNPNTFVLYFLSMFGKIGVVIFILISSYFMIENKFTLRKLLILGGEVYFYSFLILAGVIIFLSPSVLTIPTIGASLLPISHNGYWFITCYIILMLFSPYLNKFIKSISKNTLIKIILLSILLWSVFPTIVPSMTTYPTQNIYIGNNFQYSPLILFFVVYLIGAYIRLYLDIDKFSFNKLIGGFVISVIILFIGTAFFGYLDTVNSSAHLWWSLPIDGVMDKSLHYNFFFENKFFALTTSIFLFLIFLKRKEFSNRYINYIAGSALGVYLIHANCNLCYLSFAPFHFNTYYNSPYLFLVGIGIVCIIYIVCTVVDIIRRQTIEKLWIWIVDNKLNFLSNWIDGISNYLIKIVS